jgi:hypothetical protein
LTASRRISQVIVEPARSPANILYDIFAAGVFMATFSSNRWPRQTLPPLILGGITGAVAMTILPWAVQASRTTTIYSMMALAGFSTMVRLNPGSLHALGHFPALTAPITCLLLFAQPLGGLVGLTLMSTIFTNKSGPQQEDAKEGIMWAFIAVVPFMWLCLLLTSFLGNVWISKDAEHEVVRGAYIWSLVRGKKLQRERVTRGHEQKVQAQQEGTRQDVEAGVAGG